MNRRANWIHRLLIVYLILQSPASGLILCWGDCGHLAVEISSLGDAPCHGSQICDGEAVYVDDAANSPASPCSACWDIPLAIQSQLDVNPSTRIQDSGVFNSIASSVLTPIIPTSPITYNSMSEPHPPHGTILPNLQSVRLLN